MKRQLSWQIIMVEQFASQEKDEEGAALEIFNAIGESIAVVTVPVSAVAPRRADQVPSVRPLLVTA